MKAFIILLLTACAAMADVPTGTVTRSISVYTNTGLLVDTNFTRVNGIADTGSVAEVAANLATVSNTAVSAVASASVAQATANYSMSTGMAAQVSASSAIASNAALNARVTAVETNHATLAQGANADAALSKVVAIEPVYTTNIVWMGELDGGGWDYVNGQATNAGWRLPTKDELVAKVMSDPGWINDMYWSGTETEPGNAYLVIAHDFETYTNGQYLSVPKDGEYWAQAVRTVITTNLVWASLAQGSKADTAAQPNGTPATTNYSLAVSGGASLVGQVATLVLSSRVTVAVSSPLASISYDSTASGSGAQIAMEYWHAGGWTNECIDPCYTGSIYYAAMGPGGMEGSSDVVASNWAVKVWGHPENLNAANDFRGTVVSLDTPTAPEHGSTKAYVDAQVGAVTPINWAQYDANGAATGKDGVDLAGKRLYLSPAYSILSVASDGHWALQHNGRDVLTVQMDVQGCAISNATFGSTITIGVDTNTIQSAPWPEVCTDLVAGNWTAIADYTSTNNGAFLDISFSNAWTAASFRVMQTGTNASTLVSSVTFVAPGIVIAGTNAAWQTMEVPGFGGTTNTIRYLGAP
jgi:hypothetical protein